MGPFGTTFTPHGSHAGLEVMVLERFFDEKQARQKENVKKNNEKSKFSENPEKALVFFSFSWFFLDGTMYFLMKINKKYSRNGAWELQNP